MDINAVEVYEKFLGFPEIDSNAGGSSVAERFYRHCKEHIAFPELPKDLDIRLRVLSIGTGYGRADFPLLKAYIEHYEETQPYSSLWFDIECVDRSGNFLKELQKTVENDRYKIFGDKQLQPAQGIEGFLAHGNSASGKSKITIRSYFGRIEDHITRQVFANKEDNYHCIIGILSLQCVANMKVIFPKILASLRDGGAIIIGEVTAEASWLAKPPPPQFALDQHFNRRWHGLWRDWHYTLRKWGINRRLRLFMPHNFSLLIDSLKKEDSGFKNGIKPEHSEFHWKRIINQEVFSAVKQLIRSDGWKNCVSSLYLPVWEYREKEQIGNKIIDELETSKDRELSLEWKDFRTDIQFTNGIKLYVYLKDRHENEKTYTRNLQLSVLLNSSETLREQGLYWYSQFESSNVRTFHQLSDSLRQHIEVDRGCFLAMISVVNSGESKTATKVSKVSVGGRLIPSLIQTPEDEYKRKFFEGLNLNIKDKDERTSLQRIWLWLYMLYLCMSKKGKFSERAHNIQEIFNFDTDFKCVVVMDSDQESITFHESQLILKLDRRRHEELRQKVWRYIAEEMAPICSSIVNWETSSEIRAVEAIEEFWDKSSYIINVMKHGCDFLDMAFNDSFDLNPGLEDRLFGRHNFGKILEIKEGVFRSWASSGSGIYKDLKEMNLVKPFEHKRVEEIWHITVAPLYLFSIMMYEVGTRYIFHVPNTVRDLSSIWSGYHIFMHAHEFSYFTQNKHYPQLNNTYSRFIEPFDSLIYQDMVKEFESHGRKLGVQDGMAKKELDITHNTFDYFITFLENEKNKIKTFSLEAKNCLFFVNTTLSSYIKGNFHDHSIDSPFGSNLRDYVLLAATGAAATIRGRKKNAAKIVPNAQALVNFLGFKEVTTNFTRKPSIIKKESFATMFVHCAKQAMYHTACHKLEAELTGESLNIEVLINNNYVQVTITNPGAPPKDPSQESKDKSYLKVFGDYFGAHTIKGPEYNESIQKWVTCFSMEKNLR